MLRFLSTVRIRRLRAPLALVLELATDWSESARVDVDVNSVDDGDHGPATLHGKSLAVDLDTAGDLAADLELLFQHLRVWLPPGYDVIHEGDHVHVEYDSRRTSIRMARRPT